MPRTTFIAPQAPTRRDTIGLRTVFRYDPTTSRPTTPVMVGPYVVMRRPILDSVHIEYTVRDGDVTVWKAISRPDEHDCRTAVEQHRVRVAASMTVSAIAQARKRKPRALRVREVA